jgi:hypothetical protein
MWQPKSHNWENEELSISIEPYRFEHGVKRDPLGRLDVDLLAGTAGVEYFVDVTIENRSSAVLTFAFRFHKVGRGGGPGGRGLLLAAFVLPRLESTSAVRFRLNQFPGDTLTFGWQNAIKPPDFSNLLCVDKQCWRQEDSGVTVESISMPDAFEVYHATLKHSTTWTWIEIDRANAWNDIDLCRQFKISAIPSEAALSVASEAIVGALCRRPDLLRDANPMVFESFIGAILHEQGFEVEFTARGADGGVDLFAIAGPSYSPTLHLVQCKRYRGKVGIQPLRELYGLRQVHGASKALLVTPSHFTKPAAKFASNHPWEISLLDWEGLLSCLNDFAYKKA